MRWGVLLRGLCLCYHLFSFFLRVFFHSNRDRTHFSPVLGRSRGLHLRFPLLLLFLLLLPLHLLSSVHHERSKLAIGEKRRPDRRRKFESEFDSTAGFLPREVAHKVAVRMTVGLEYEVR